MKLTNIKFHVELVAEDVALSKAFICIISLTLQLHLSPPLWCATDITNGRFATPMLLSWRE